MLVFRACAMRHIAYADMYRSRFLLKQAKCKNQICIQEEIKNRLYSRNACYRSVQSLLSSCLLSKNLNIKINKLIILPTGLVWVWKLEEQRWRVFGKRVLKRIFGPKREELAGDWRRLHSEELHNFITSAARTLGSWVRIPLVVWMCVSDFLVVLSCVGNGFVWGRFPVQGVLPTV
jgi:hypothetical protein